MLADPLLDPVLCVSICLSDDVFADGDTLQEICLVVDAELPAPRHCVPGGVSVHSVPSEDALLAALISLVRSLDPDFILGFDVHAGSLGYLTERCAHLGGQHAALLQQLSRTPEHMPPAGLRVDDYGRDHGAGIWVTGRCVLNFWRIARSELGLGSYSFEAAMMALLQRRVPAHTRATLGEWYDLPVQRWRVVAHLAAQARGCLLMCTQLDLIGRTSELARVFGIDFNSVITRGSQFRVEAMMLRLAHTQNYVALSPSKEALAESNGPAIIALVRCACVCFGVGCRLSRSHRR
jgi:DNA polymerase zeta